MTRKRPCEVDGFEFLSPEAKRSLRLKFQKAVMDVMEEISADDIIVRVEGPVQDEVERVILPFHHLTESAPVDVLKGNSMDEMITRMEPFFRKVVRDEVERNIPSLFYRTARTSLNQVEPSERRGLQLLFVNKLPSLIFTGSKIEAEDGGPLKIVLIDANSKNVVNSDPLSSMKIEIVVLDGDFCSDDQDDWTENEFRAKVVHERVGKRPLVTGELNVTLEEGAGIIGDIVFTDNSSWLRCRKFRLGARVVESCGAVRIKEARSEAFVVKDHRGELYKKHHPPSLDDEIWRLEKVAKDGKFQRQLAAKQIKTERFPAVILGASNKTWEIIVQHATSAVDYERLYAYPGNPDGISWKVLQFLGKLNFINKDSLEWIFVITNLVLELPSVVLDQLSSIHKHQYVLFAMLLSFAAMLICIIELVYKGRKQKVIWRWRRSRLPWLYDASQNYKPFGTFKDFVGSVSALCQCIVTAINFAEVDKPINLCLWPIIFGLGLLGSKMLENPENRTIV